MRKEETPFIRMTMGIAVLLLIAESCGLTLVKIYHLPLLFTAFGFLAAGSPVDKKSLRQTAFRMLRLYLLGFALLVVFSLIKNLLLDRGKLLSDFTAWVKAGFYGKGAGKQFLISNVKPIGVFWVFLGLFWALLIAGEIAESKWMLCWAAAIALLGHATRHAGDSAKIVTCMPWSLQAGMVGCFFLTVGIAARKQRLLKKRPPLLALAGIAALCVFGMVYKITMNMADPTFSYGLLNAAVALAAISMTVFVCRWLQRFHWIEAALSWCGNNWIKLLSVHGLESKLVKWKPVQKLIGRLLKGDAANLAFLAVRIAVIIGAVILLNLLLNSDYFNNLKKKLSDTKGVLSMKKFFANIRNYRSYMAYSAVAALRTDVSESYLNWLWWILDPLCFMLVYSFVAVVVFGRSEPHILPFIFVGYSTWTFASKSVNQSVKLVRSNKSILSRVYLPKYILVGSMLAENLVRYLISICLCFVIMAIDHVPFTVYLLWLPVVVFFLALFLFGICMILLHAGVYMNDLTNIVNTIMRLLFYLSGVFFNIVKRVPAPYGSLLTYLNPFAMYMQEMRNLMIYQTTPRFHVIGIWAIISVINCVIGISLIHKHEQTYVKAI